MLRFVVCEGPDDLGALRALLRSLSPDSTIGGSKHGKRLVCENQDVRVVLEAAPDGKSGLARHALDLAEGTASQRPDAIGIVFDPDGDQPDKERTFFTREYNKLSKMERRGTALQPTNDEYRVAISRRDVRILLGAWRSKRPIQYARIPDEQNLERVLIGGILESRQNKAIGDWAEKSTKELIELVSDHGWKRAFRIWNAALEPKSESFVDKLLESNLTKSACLNALATTPAAKILESLLLL